MLFPIAARAPETRARRDAEDDRVRETWRRLKHGHGYARRAVVADFAAALEDAERPAALERLLREAGLV